MNKQHQIEEMAKTMCEDFGTDVCKFDCPCMNTCANEDISERLYNAGYRKLPEDSVVLSREERQARDYECQNIGYEVGKKEARKETAEKILKDLIKNCQYTFGVNGKPIIALDGDFALNTAKSYGVEIKE